MKRDMEFVRQLIIDFSEGKGKTTFVNNLYGEPTEEYLRDQKYIYHLKIMKQAGLISFNEYNMKIGYRLESIPELTWRGQDFLNTLEDDTVWNKTKEAMKKKGLEVGKVSFDTIIEFAKFKVKEKLGMAE